MSYKLPASALLTLMLLLVVLGSSAVMSAYPFTWHMLLHMANVAIIAPLLVLLTPRRYRVHQAGMLALVACALEFFVVWGWHVPVLHQLARLSNSVFYLEQTTFLLAGYAVWATALPLRNCAATGNSGLVGTVALLVTSMHMTLLGALLSISTRVLYPHAHAAPAEEITPGMLLFDQQLGGVLMLTIGGLCYLAGGVVTLMFALRSPSQHRALSL